MIKVHFDSSLNTVCIESSEKIDAAQAGKFDSEDGSFITLFSRKQAGEHLRSQKPAIKEKIAFVEMKNICERNFIKGRTKNVIF